MRGVVEEVWGSAEMCGGLGVGVGRGEWGPVSAIQLRLERMYCCGPLFPNTSSRKTHKQSKSNTDKAACEGNPAVIAKTHD